MEVFGQSRCTMMADAHESVRDICMQSLNDRSAGAIGHALQRHRITKHALPIRTFNDRRNLSQSQAAHAQTGSMQNEI